MKIILVLGFFAVVLGQNSHYYSTVPEDIRKGFNAVDINHDDSLTRDGLLNFTEYNLTVSIETHVLLAEGEFRYYDRLDGTIDGKSTDSIGDPLINILDSNKDGRVTLHEYQQNIAHVIDGATREIDGLAG